MNTILKLFKGKKVSESETANPLTEFHKTETYFLIGDANWKMYHPARFNTEEEARKVIRDEYENRSKNDGYDEYWRNRKQLVIKVTETVL
jgi:hypothetical protein